MSSTCPQTGILLVTYLAKSHRGIPLVAQYWTQDLSSWPTPQPHLISSRCLTEVLKGSGLSPGKGGGRHLLTHDQITPLSRLPPLTPCSPVLACFFLPMLGPSASAPRHHSLAGATPVFHHTWEPRPIQVCVSGFTRKGLEKRKAKDLKCI